MEITKQRIGTTTVVRLAGALDSNSAAETHEKIVPLILDPGPVLFDFTGVTTISDAGIRTMLVIYRQSKAIDDSVAIVGLHLELRRALKATGFLKYFVVADDVASGIRALRDDDHERSVAA